MSALSRSALRAIAFCAALGGGILMMDQWFGTPVDTGELILLAIVMIADLVIVGWEKSSIGRLLKPGSRSTGTDLFYGALIYSGVFSLFVTGFSFGMDHLINSATQALQWQRPQIDLPVLIAVPLMFVVNSLAGYGAHRLLHTRWLWPLHAVHHAPREMTLLNAERVHPLEVIVRMVFAPLPGLLLGLDPLSAVVLWKFTAVLVYWQHSNVPNPFPWIERWLIAGPINHRIHHARNKHLHDRNLSNCPLIDRLFGTYAWTDEVVELGIEDRQLGNGNPVSEMIAIQWRWLMSLLPRGRNSGPSAALAKPSSTADTFSISRQTP